MKKFLSLVLALVMTMSLVTVSAGAKDFTDDSEITYKEAVDVISALGVVDGYSGGDFRPDDVLTRGAAAKIICNLILGPTTASALTAGTAPFKDVPVTNTFAGYITYCSQQGIISGYADGTFRPTGTLSGNAFMKMLLGALGYDSSIESYTGANWTVSASSSRPAGIGLDDGNDEFVGSEAVTRQEAALYAFNMLQATMVEYDQQNTIVVGDIDDQHHFQPEGCCQQRQEREHQ
ncbi:MAG: S-layer homology domain-containing protein [Dysosmobacter welbionis]